MRQLFVQLVIGAALHGGAAATASSAAAPDGTINVPADQPTIQAGINAAVNGDTVLVAPGTYHEAINFGGKMITVTSSAGPAKTILSGAGLNATVVSIISAEPAGTMLSGFTIRDALIAGQGDGGGVRTLGSSPTIFDCVFESNHAYWGGGAYCNGGAPSITNCTFTGNSATEGAGVFAHLGDLHFEGNTLSGNCALYFGGGVRLTQMAAPSVADCTFAGNTVGPPGCAGGRAELISGSPSGGAISCEGSLTVHDSTLIGNTCQFTGGAIHVIGASHVFTNTTFIGNEGPGGGAVGIITGHASFNDCAFHDNIGASGGAIWAPYSFSGAILQIVDCGFEGNQATSLAYESGGAVCFSVNNTTMTRCTFIGNSCGNGGAIYGRRGANAASTPVIRECLFSGNTAFGADLPAEGFISGGGACFFEANAHARLTNCLFTGNSASPGRGGAVMFNGYGFCCPLPGGSINNCTFVGNSSTGGGGAGGAVFVASAPETGPSHANIYNSIVWNGAGGGPTPIAVGGASTVTVSRCDVQGGHAGVGNLNLDPLFVSATDFHVQRGSPCIDAGDNALLPLGVVTDLDGSPRVQGCSVDIGAYEHVADTCPADIAPPPVGNNVVNVDDLLAVINNWGPCANPDFCPADFAPFCGNGVVGVDELLAIINAWGACP